MTTGLMPSSVSAGELRTVPYRQCSADEVPCSMLRVRSSADTAICSKALWQGILAVAYLVEDALHEDHPHVDVPCNVGQELRDQVIGGIGCVADHNAGDGGGAISIDARDVEIAELGADGVGEQVCVVGHRCAVVVLRNHSRGDGMESAAWKARMRHATVVRVFVGEGGNEEGAEELAGGVLQEGVTGISTEALPSGPVGGVGVGADGQGGGARDRNQVAGVLEVVEGQMALLLRGERDGNGGVEESGIGIRGFDAGCVRTADAVGIRTTVCGASGMTGCGGGCGGADSGGWDDRGWRVGQRR